MKGVARAQIQLHVQLYAFQGIVDFGIPGTANRRIPGPFFGGHRFCRISNRLPRDTGVFVQGAVILVDCPGKQVTEPLQFFDGTSRGKGCDLLF
jgi:hypothetical protein